MRRRNISLDISRKQALKVVKELDAFPKIPDSYKSTSASGGGVSILVFLCLAVLIYSEFKYYSNTELKFDYQVDTNHSEKLKINVDITVAMRCRNVGADVLDLTNQNAYSFGQLQEEDVQFELTANQMSYLKMIQNINDYIKNEYHALHTFLWKSGFSSQAGGTMPAREGEETEGEKDGCRFHGSLLVNKVAGNFHITAGKPLSIIPGSHAHLMVAYDSGLFGGHAHLNLVDNKNYNFSHRIDHFSFGEQTPGIVNPLDGDYKVIENNYHMFQYFVQVVPTKVSTSQAQVDTFQYAVTERNRSIDHGKGSHGVPGIFVKYDMSSLKVLVREEYKPFSQFLIRLCGIVGGIFATSGMLHGLVKFLVDVVCCRLKVGKYNESKDYSRGMPRQQTPITLETSPATLYTDDSALDVTLSGPQLHPQPS